MYQDKLNPQDLPTLQEVRAVEAQLREVIYPLTWGLTHTGIDTLPAIYEVWHNSTKTKGVREVSITIRYTKTQAIVDATIGKHEQFTKALPQEAVHVYTYNFCNGQPNFRAKNNCLKLFYRSSK